MKRLIPSTSRKRKYYIYEEENIVATLFQGHLIGAGKDKNVKVYIANLIREESTETEYIALKIIHCQPERGLNTAEKKQREQIQRNNEIKEFYHQLPDTDNKRCLIAPYDVLKLNCRDGMGVKIYYVFVLMPLCQTKDCFKVIRDSYHENGENSDKMEALRSQSLQSQWFPMLLDILLWLHSRGLPHRDIKAENISIGDSVKLFDFEFLVIPSTKDSCTPGSVPSSKYVLMLSSLWETKLDEHQRLMIHIHGDLFALSMILCQIFFPSLFQSACKQDLKFLNSKINAFKRNQHHLNHASLLDLISQQQSERFILMQLLIADIEARTQQAQQNLEASPAHGQLIITLLQMVSVNEDILCDFVVNLALATQLNSRQNEYIDFELQRMPYQPPELIEETKEEKSEEEDEEKTTAPLTHIRLFPRTENKNRPSSSPYSCLQQVRRQRTARQTARCLNNLKAQVRM